MQDGTPSCRHADAVVARHRRGNRIACTGFQVSGRVPGGFFFFFLDRFVSSRTAFREFGGIHFPAKNVNFFRGIFVGWFNQFISHERESLWEIWNNRRRLTLITMFVRNFLVDWFSGSICELWEIFINLSCLLGMFEIVDFAVKSINFLVTIIGNIFWVCFARVRGL